MSSALLMPGPLHPDLFDGTTPTMAPAAKPLRPFKVEVCRRAVVAAHDRAEAERIAAEALLPGGSQGHSCELVRIVARPMTAAEVRAYTARQREGEKQ